jgi:putative membrane protein
MSLWLYLLYFPFALISKAQAFDWYTIPYVCLLRRPLLSLTPSSAVAFTSFLFLGFLEIGQEIEDPFGYDENDLDLDGFCMNIQRELAEITAHTAPAPDQYIFTAWNQPFAPADRRNAEEIVRDAEHDYHDRAAGLAHMRRTLLKSWRLVDNQTRLHYEVDAPITPA